MPQAVLIGLDGSEYSRSATDLGIRFARQHGASLTGMAIVDEPGICAPGPVPLGGGSAKRAREQVQLSEAHQKTELFLEAFSKQCASAMVQAGGVKKVGEPAQQLVLEAQAHDVVLLGKETFFQFETQEEPDDTLITVIKNVPRPVISVPRLLPDEGPVVIAWDGSVQVARAISSFQSLQLHAGKEVHVLAIQAKQQEATDSMDRAVRFLSNHQVTAHRQFVISAADPADIILEKLAKLQAGLLVMGAYGKSTITEFFFGSVTRTLLRECPVPILVDH